MEARPFTALTSPVTSRERLRESVVLSWRHELSAVHCHSPQTCRALSFGTMELGTAQWVPGGYGRRLSARIDQTQGVNEWKCLQTEVHNRRSIVN